MRPARAAATAFGLLAVAMGVLWIGQGLGVIRWPASSFMISQRVWSVYGAILALIGAGVAWGAQRTGRR
jgi:hypothetical protein